MENLAYLSPLSSSAENIALIFITFFLFFFITSISLVIRRFSLNILKKKQARNLSFIENQIFDYLNEGGILSLPQKKYQNKIVQRHLIKLSGTVNGLEKERVHEIYTYLGFYKNDIEALVSGARIKSTKALSRLRTLSINPPNIDWNNLIGKSTCPIYRWAIMDYILVIKKSKGVFWLAGFLTDHRNYHNGIIQHLLCCLASFSSDLVLFILTHTDDKRIIEQCIRTLALYPQVKAEDAILSQMKKGASEEIYISAVLALGGAITDKTLDIFSLIISHKHWVVRLNIAKALGNIDDPKALKILSKLIEDINYFVRLSALKSLSSGNHDSSLILKNILENKNHPSHELLPYCHKKSGIFL